MEDSSLTLLPMSQTIELAPGETYEGYITVANPDDSKTDVSFQTSVEPFSVSGQDYQADFAAQSNRTMITKWVDIPEPTGTVKPNESKKIKFVINVPEDAPAGGQYAAIAVTYNKPVQSTHSEGITNNIENIFELASIIYAKVAGETEHSGRILENNLPGFSTTTPVYATALIENTGNVHESANYFITISDFFTGQVILPNDQSSGRYSEVIMPDSTYRSVRELSGLPAVGAVKVKQAIEFNGELSEAESVVIICPVWFMVLVALTLISLVAVITVLIRRSRRQKRII